MSCLEGADEKSAANNQVASRSPVGHRQATAQILCFILSPTETGGRQFNCVCYHLLIGMLATVSVGMYKISNIHIKFQTIPKSFQILKNHFKQFNTISNNSIIIIIIFI
jgi:hypothetical protein